MHQISGYVSFLPKIVENAVQTSSIVSSLEIYYNKRAIGKLEEKRIEITDLKKVLPTKPFVLQTNKATIV